jgi:hypothetical protein
MKRWCSYLLPLLQILDRSKEVCSLSDFCRLLVPRVPKSVSSPQYVQVAPSLRGDVLIEPLTRCGLTRDHLHDA